MTKKFIVRVFLITLIILFLFLLAGSLYSQKTEEEWNKKIDEVIKKIYDPSQEPPFDKNEIIEMIKKFGNNKNVNDLYSYIYSNFIQKKRFKAAKFTIETFIATFPDKSYYDDQIGACLYTYLTSGVEEGDKCVLKAEFDYSNIKNPDERKIEEIKIIKQRSDYSFNDYLIKYSIVYNFPDELSDILIDRHFSIYNNINEREKKHFLAVKENRERNRKMAAIHEKYRQLRIKQVNNFLAELEQLLVERDGQKLKVFLKKYTNSEKDCEKFYNRYKKKYLSRNFTKVTFIADPSFQINGFTEEMHTIEYQIKTDPITINEECPDKINTENGPEYCRTILSFYFSDERMYLIY